MKNKNSKARMQVIFGALLFALMLIVELYTMFNFPRWYIVIAVLAVAELGFLYMIINGLFIMREQKELRSEEQYDSIFKSEKASYLMLKKYFEEIEDKLNYLEKAAKVPTEEIINAQKGISKVIVNRNRENMEALMNSNDIMVEQINGYAVKLEELAQEIAANKEAIVQNQDALAAIVSGGADRILEDQKGIKDSNEKAIQVHEQELLVNMKDMEIRLNSMIAQSQKAVVQTADAAVPASQPQSIPPTDYQPQADTVLETQAMTDDTLTNVLEEESVVEEAMTEPETAEEIIEPEPVAELPEEAIESEPVVELPEEAIEPEPVAEFVREVAEPEPVAEPVEEVKPPMPDLSDPNKPMSADDIAALFANMGANDAAAEPEPVTESVQEVAEPEPVAELVEEVKPPMPDLSDPNKPMSADDIAALFANMGANDAAAEPEPVAESAQEAIEPEPVVEPVEEEKPPMPDLSDPNKPMSADDIAALFANMGANDTAAEEAAEPEPVVEPVEEVKPPMPDLSDPNKSMSPDDIAALFASMGA